MKLDRTYQRELLEELAACYPDRAAWAERVKSTDAETKTKYLANLAYLNEHGLVSSMDDSGLQFDLSSTLGSPQKAWTSSPTTGGSRPSSAS